MAERSSGRGQLFWAKVFRTDTEIVVAVCDEDLLGREIRDPELGITIRIDPDFYGGELLEFDEVLELLREATVANIIGNNIVEKLVEAGYIDSSSQVSVIGGVKHVQVVVFSY